jgi:hypothetical protein
MGGTGARTVAEAAANLRVPTLAGDNTFTGDNTLNGNTTFNAPTTFDASIESTHSGEDTLANLICGYVDTGGVLGVARGLMLHYVAKTADYPLTTDDCVVNVTANSPTLTLPTAVVASGGGSMTAGTVYIIKNSGAGTITLATTGGQTIDGAAPGTIAAGNSLTLVSTGANWIIV